MNSELKQLIYKFYYNTLINIYSTIILKKQNICQLLFMITNILYF